MLSSSLLLLSLILAPQLVAGYSFELTSVPTQCGQLHVNLTEGTGTPPYSVLVVPFGASPLSTEKRTVLSHNFTGTSTSFQMAYPSNSNFVIAVGDANGIGTGGTSVPTNVNASNDASCLPDKVSTQFSFQLLPNTAINECVPVTLAWDSAAQGDVKIQLVIPGGQTTTIPQTGVKSGLQGNTTGFSWTPDVPVGTNIILLAGDSRGVGTGGSVNNAIGNNPNGDTSCVNSNSPSSTPGPAAGAVETGAPSNNSSSGGSSTNAGAIAGGVVGGIAAVIIAVLLTLFFVRRRRHQKDRKRHSLDLLPESGHPNNEQYQPEPFIIPSSVGSRSQHARTMSNGSEDDDEASGTRPSMSEVGRRYSALSTTDQSEGTSNYLGVPRTTTYTTTSRKSPHPATLRPVNFVQHEDAGEIPAEGEASTQEPETVELPPTYDAIRR